MTYGEVVSGQRVVRYCSPYSFRSAQTKLGAYWETFCAVFSVQHTIGAAGWCDTFVEGLLSWMVVQSDRFREQALPSQRGTYPLLAVPACSLNSVPSLVASSSLRGLVLLRQAGVGRRYDRAQKLTRVRMMAYFRSKPRRTICAERCTRPDSPALRVGWQL